MTALVGQLADATHTVAGPFVAVEQPVDELGPAAVVAAVNLAEPLVAAAVPGVVEHAVAAAVPAVAVLDAVAVPYPLIGSEPVAMFAEAG